MNILITSIGKRGYLVKHFKDILGDQGQVFGADSNKYAPALQNVDKAFIIPMANDDHYFDRLLKLCIDYNVDAIFSINDLELPFLSAKREEFAEFGIQVIISSPDIIEICYDKYLTYCFLQENNLPAPLTYLSSEKDKILRDISNGIINYPILAKPRRGSRSQGIYLLGNEKQLLYDMEKVKNSNIKENEKHIYQQHIESDQYSIHIINNKSGEPVSVVGMVNIIRHTDGETFNIKSIKDQSLIKLGIMLGKKLKHFGFLSADVHKTNDGFTILELNPRIPGCYSLSHCAANFTEKIIKIIKGQTIEENIDCYSENVIMLKQFTTFIKTKEEIDNNVIKDYVANN